ncbi:MAG: M28 family peptidase [bacterium]|nr:M28 family peptidase [bacterium]
MKKAIQVCLVLILVFNFCAAETIDTTFLKESITAANLYTLVETLSSPQYEGRLTGSSGYDKAADLSVQYFKDAGLVPAFPGYKQTFPVSFTKVHKSTLEFYLKNDKGEKETVTCEYFEDFYPLLFSGKGDVENSLVFVGYGLTAPDLGYDDYKDMDVKGKIVLVLKGVPEAKDGEDWKPYNSHRHRTANARAHGALGLLYIYNRPVANPNGVHIENFPMALIHNDLADRLFSPYKKTVDELKKQLNKREGASFIMDKQALRGHLIVESEPVKSESHNVVGIIPGSDPQLKDECIVIGGHLDHCGRWPVLTPGANDNASGSAAVIAMARALAKYPRKMKRSVMFCLFTGEETGLLGSKQLVAHLPGTIKKVTFALNLDMVGVGDGIFVYRLKNYPELETIYTEARDAMAVSFEITGNKVEKPRPMADHSPFVEKGIPAVSIFSRSGGYPAYHTDKDTIFKITPKILACITRMTAYTAIRLANE